MSNDKQPFQIAVSEGALSLLKKRLDDTRFPDEINGADWAYGAPLAEIRRLAERWRYGYDWRACVSVLRIFLASRWMGQ